MEAPEFTITVPLTGFRVFDFHRANELFAVGRAAVRHRPRALSLLVTTHLTRARRSLLEDLSIDWLPLSTAEFAGIALVEVRDRKSRRGSSRLARQPSARVGRSQSSGHRDPNQGGVR
jgi:hypothetical protein